MKRLLTYLILLIAATGCTSKSELLSKGSWNIQSAVYGGKPIVFNSTSISFKMADGNGAPAIWFFKDGKTLLPGINCRDISAKWNLKEDILTLTIDSSYYNRVYNSEVEVDIAEFFNGIETIETDSVMVPKNDHFIKKNPLLSNEFYDAMKIYGEPFIIELDNDYLKLKSNSSSFIATKDKTLENLFRGLRY